MVTLIFFCLIAATNERAGLLPPLEAILKSFLNPLLMFQIHSLILSKNNLHFNVLIPAWRIVFRNKYTADFTFERTWVFLSVFKELDILYKEKQAINRQLTCHILF